MKATKSIDLLIRNIKKHREYRKWNQVRLSKESGLDPSNISRIEKGERNITLDVLDKIAKAFEIPSFELLQNMNVDEMTLRNKIAQVESLENLKKLMIEEMIGAFIREKEQLK